MILEVFYISAMIKEENDKCSSCDKYLTLVSKEMLSGLAAFQA